MQCLGGTELGGCGSQIVGPSTWAIFELKSSFMGWTAFLVHRGNTGEMDTGGSSSRAMKASPGLQSFARDFWTHARRLQLENHAVEEFHLLSLGRG